MPPEITDKKNVPINVGDTVSTKFRGGKHAGEVETIVTTKEEAEEYGAKNPPKVLFADQNGEKFVSHNPKTLVHGDNPR
ncbi:hypothetical protein BDQ17DRAFT_1248327 [Cyathus striatus]|nr:hypothetical protein BDQ17DRAFT_1248327 [Cyathus striatus]